MAQGFYSDQTITALTTSYHAFTFPFESKSLILQNDDSTNSIVYSWDGVHQHGMLKPSESVKLDNMALDGTNTISLKATPAAASYRLTVVG